MRLPRSLTWSVGIVLAPIVLAVLFIAVFGWNWLRGPIERLALEKTGRALAIMGDLTVTFAWPRPRMRAEAVTFANPPWAREKHMLDARGVEIAVDLLGLLHQDLVFAEVRLERPVVFLEQGSGGRKNWLLDTNQQDEGARVRIDRLTIDAGKLGYDDALQKTSIRVDLSSADTQPGGAGGAGIVFSATGQYRGQAARARGSGGPVLALRDEATPYPLMVEASIGKTSVRADGTVTSLLKLSALDMRMALKGDSLDQLFAVLGIALPATPVYATQGHLVRTADTWKYEKFSGRFGQSDIAGSLQVVTGGARPVLTADLTSRLLDIEDLGPLIGARPGGVDQASAPTVQTAGRAGPAPARVLPDLPFRTERWSSVDADVTLSAKTIRRAKELPLENLVTHLSMRDSVLKLDPLDFGLAGGQLGSTITLDGRRNPIQAAAKVRARRVLLAKLFPAVALNQTSIGQINGEFDLTGTGNSVGRMLATSNGKVGLVVAGGEISRLMMETVGLHLWEILQLNLTGDRQIRLRCVVANFDVKQGVMRTDALVFDTAITTIVGTGTIDLGREILDLTLRQKTKNTSPLALRSPIHVRGTFAKPTAQVDKTQVAARALGALALGAINPLLAIVPLIDPGPGKDSDCRQLVREARALPRPKARTRAR